MEQKFNALILSKTKLEEKGECKFGCVSQV